MSTPTLAEVLIAISAASQVDDFDTRRLHLATARARYARVVEEVARAGRDISTLEADLVRRTQSSSGQTTIADAISKVAT